MGLFDAISPNTAPIRRAGAITQQGYGQARGDITGGTKAALGDIGSAQGQAQDVLRQQAAEALKYLTGGTEKAGGYLSQALPGWQTLEGMGQQGLDLYGRLVGLGGQGIQGIESAVESLPGYQWARDQALQGLDRAAAGAGRYNPTDVMQAATGMAGNLWQQLVGNLSPYFGLATGAQSGLTGTLGSLADLYSRAGAGEADIASGLGSNLANLYTGTGAARAGLQSQQGQSLAGIDVAKAKAKADTLAQLFNANQAGSQNFLGLISGLAGPAAYLGGALV